MLGFALGALFVWALHPSDRQLLEPRVPAPTPAKTEELPAPKPAEVALSGPPPQSMETIDNVFALWGPKYAVWDNVTNTTEVALWDPQTKNFSHCFEVLRTGDRFYFRPIPQLTRPLLKHGAPQDPSCPLQFTDTEEQDREWTGAKNEEIFRALTNTISGQASPPPKP
jgi:hypothetical protein